MTYQNTVIALLVIAIFSVAAHEARDQAREVDHAADCSRDHSVSTVSTSDIRVARISKPSLAEALGEPGRVASLLGLESRGSLADHRGLAAIAFGDASHAVMQVQERDGRVVPLVVLAE